jgi:methyl-accepting chemotaxis protein
MYQSRMVYLAAFVPFALAGLLGVVGLVGAGSADMTNTLMVLVLVTAVAGLVLSATAIRNFLRVLGADPGQLLATANELDQGAHGSGAPIVGGTIMSRLQALKEYLTASSANALVTARIQQAIDNADTNIMIADAERMVVYMNDSVIKMLRNAEGEIRKDLPDFSVDKVLNGCIDRFHKVPSHQIQLLDNLRGTHRAEIKLGNSSFGLIANPIITATGERLGTVVEWKDLTAEKRMEELAVFNTRIRAAIDSAETNIMIATPDRRVVYMNESVTEMLRKAQSQIRRDLPDFDVDKVLNGSIDRFHKDPSHQMKMLEQLKATHRTQIKLGDNTFGLIASPIFDDNGTRLGTVVEWKDRTLELKAEQEAVANTRIRQAIDNSTSNIMIADTDRNVVYMNKAVESMLRASESEIRKGLPGFEVDTVLNGSIDRFHKDPSYQMSMLSRLKSTHRAEIVIGADTFGLIASPIFAQDQSRLGTVVEWSNRTDELKTSSEVTNLVRSASAGNFATRIQIEGKNGFFLELAEGLNNLMETSDRGLQDIARVLGAIAEGDLTERVEADYEGTFLELKEFCNKTTENLTTMISEIRQAADTIYTASSEIAGGNADLSSRTEQQASSLEETASSMEELTSTVRTNTDNAKQANVLAEQASGVARNGGDLIRQVVVTMESINESSRKISDIIGVIDGIAFQTNILALNAAVEAARAGEQGRGFAVVASEVRTLAQRSADAAKDIKQLISDSTSRIEGGNQLVNKSGETMEEIVTAIKRVNDIMSEIAAASVEQSSGIEEVNTAVNQMDEMTQQNAALVEQAAAAAESLQSQAEQLQNNLSVFRLDDADEGRQSRLTPKHAARVSRPAKAEPMSKSAAAKPAIGNKKAPVAAPRKPKVPPQDAENEWESF